MAYSFNPTALKKLEMARDRKALRRLEQDSNSIPLSALRKSVSLDIAGNPVVGYGRYRRRRYSSRRGYGGYFGRKIGGWFGQADLGDRLGDAAAAYADRVTGLPISGMSDMLGKAMGSRSSAPTGVASGTGRYRRRRYRRGYGAYTSGISDVQQQEVPNMSNPRAGDGAVVIQHKEYLGDVIATGSGFNVVYNLPINPSSSATFPWLSGVGQLFEQYRLEGIIFKFVSTSGSLSTTQALGEIIMSVDYNSYDAPPANKQQMLNQIMAVSKVPAFDAEMCVECNPAQSQSAGLLFTRPANGSVPGDLRNYDIGRLYVATQGVSVGGGAVTLGELWVTYQVALYKPQLVSKSFGSMHIQNSFAAAAGYYITSAATPAAPTLSYWNTLGATFTGSVISLPNALVGELYHVTWIETDYNAAVRASQNPTFSVNGGAVKSWLTSNSAQSVLNPLPTLSAGSIGGPSQSTVSFIMICNTAGALSIGVTFGLLAAGGGDLETVEFIITRYDSGATN